MQSLCCYFKEIAYKIIDIVLVKFIINKCSHFYCELAKFKVQTENIKGNTTQSRLDPLRRFMIFKHEKYFT